ncbi:hypothetical protein ASF00_14285 [Sphingomonas sp. Leaf34]|uniref:methyl-accepting chemotaxis protein n=1 Tax=Sphingomonas sp. Leaf34 TaxID=1736216 RepID=UPI00071539A4|nr:HAMP domain-containing methyl-accepting chemotaxis protein [Sphingomonas sp. Leaf34]KQN27458.1 hypothetical protein ASF00_14285 [Sphingomonas sp. Leaf34]
MIHGIPKLWSRSMVARLMVPVAIMLGLVCVLGSIGLGTRSRVQTARDAANAAQVVRIHLVEVRSLSRSLQRDALNLLLERDPRERAIIHRKFSTRSDQMRLQLAQLVGTPAARLTPHSRYIESQAVVLDRLAIVAAAASNGGQARAWAIFRRDVRPNERIASTIADTLIGAQEARVERLFRHAYDLERQEVTISVLASLVLFSLAACGTVLIVQRTIIRPLLQIERTMAAIAGGNAKGRTPHAGRRDEIGRMARAIEVFRASVVEREHLHAEAGRQQIAEVQRERQVEIRRRSFEDAEAERNRIVRQAATMLEDEIADVLAGLRGSAHQLTVTSGDLEDHSTAATRELGDVGVAVRRALDGATDIAAATTQFMGAIRQSSDSTRRTADLSAQAADRAAELARDMAGVQDDARAIGAIVGLIGSIAARTKLLALNAAMEAARVGDAGKGFAVVAGEVRMLATQTADATDEIARQIAGMQRGTHAASTGLTQIRGLVDEMARGADALASSIDEQAQSGQTINRNVDGAADDLDLIGRLVTEVSVATRGTAGMASLVRSDSRRVEDGASSIDGALSRFFGQLHLA